MPRPEAYASTLVPLPRRSHFQVLAETPVFSTIRPNCAAKVTFEATRRAPPLARRDHERRLQLALTRDVEADRHFPVLGVDGGECVAIGDPHHAELLSAGAPDEGDDQGVGVEDGAGARLDAVD